MEKPKIKNLSKNKIDIKALSPINKQTHMEGPIISSVEFHPSSTVALVAGTSGILSLFQVMTKYLIICIYTYSNKEFMKILGIIHLI